MGLGPAGIARAGENTLEEDEHRRVVIEEQNFVAVHVCKLFAGIVSELPPRRV